MGNNLLVGFNLFLNKQKYICLTLQSLVDAGMFSLGCARQPVQHVKAAKLALPNSHEMRISRMNLPRLAWVFTFFFQPLPPATCNGICCRK
jgi:hypothetical protein